MESEEGRRSTLLIVNADDYALTRGMCHAIIEAHRHGIVTSTSMLANTAAFDEGVRLLGDAPGLAVGAHLAAVGEDPPLLSAREIPTLVDRRGRLHRGWRSFSARLLARRVDPADVGREFAAQLERLTGAGIRPTHVDAHQHLHLWAPVAAVVIDLARRFDIVAIRVPRSRAVLPPGAAVRVLGALLTRRLANSGLAFPATAAGFDEAGRLNASRLASALAALATSRAPSAELTCHPGLADDPERAPYAWGYQWATELEALTSPMARQLAEGNGFRLGSYADLAPNPRRRDERPHTPGDRDG